MRKTLKRLLSLVIIAALAVSLAAPANAGTINLKVNSVNGLIVGQRLFVGPDNESMTVANIGTPGASSLGESTKAGATQLAVSGVQGFTVGQEVYVGDEKAIIAGIRAVRRGWNAPAIPNVFDTVTLSAPLKKAHSAGESFAGSGLTLAYPLRADYAAGTPLASAVPTPGAPNVY